MHNITPCKESRFRNPAIFFVWNPESRKICLWKYPESWDLESINIQLKGFEIPLTMGIQNPSCTDKEPGIHYLESGIHGVESRIQDYLGFSYMAGRIIQSWYGGCVEILHTDKFFHRNKVNPRKKEISNKRMQNSKSQRVNTARQSNDKEKPAPHRRLSSPYLYLSFRKRT